MIERRAESGEGMGVGAGTGRTLVLCSTDSCTMGFICNSRSVSMTAVAQEFDGTGCNKMRVSSLFSAGIGVLPAVAKCCQVERLFFSAGFEVTLEAEDTGRIKGASCLNLQSSDPRAPGTQKRAPRGTARTATVLDCVSAGWQPWPQST